MTSAKESIARLATIAEEKGITHAVISPGSRNAPLIIALSDTEIECLNIPDERAAGFFALGLALRTGRPVILCCTSGSAMLNYAAAIAEAYYQKVPLLVLTADRPQEWIDQRAGQTMRQSNAFSNYITASYTLMQEPKELDQLWYNDRIVNEAINTCTIHKPGPVHINIPLKEPLYNQSEQLKSAPKLIQTVETMPSISVEIQHKLRHDFSNYERILVICGQHEPSASWQKAINRLSEHKDVVVLSETTSNVYGPHVLSCIDRTIEGMSSAPAHYAPSLLITCGGSIISKKIRFLLRKMRIDQHWHIDTHDHHIDTYQSLTHNIPLSIETFVDIIEPVISSDSDGGYRRLWYDINDQRATSHQKYIKQAPWSDLKVVDQLITHIPDRSTLHAANSTSIRYLQLFDSKEGINYQCNRGVSGIDGCTSTAVGYAYTDQKLNILLTGDLAFFYDSNAFWHSYHRSNLRIVILNNEGGSIFRVIPGPESTSQLEKHFEAHHTRTAEYLAKNLHLGYQKANDEASLKEGLSWLLDQDHLTPAILEVFTPRLVNPQVLRDYFKLII